MNFEWVLILCIFFISCREKEIENVLHKSGSNRKELEYVLHHYSQNSVSCSIGFF